MSKRIPSKPWWTDYTEDNVRRYFVAGMTLVGTALGAYYWSILDTARVLKREDAPGSKHWQEKEEWKRIKEHPIHGKSQAKGVEGIV